MLRTNLFFFKSFDLQYDADLENRKETAWCSLSPPSKVTFRSEETMHYSETSWEKKDLHIKGKPLGRLRHPDGAEDSCNFTLRLIGMLV